MPGMSLDAPEVAVTVVIGACAPIFAVMVRSCLCAPRPESNVRLQPAPGSEQRCCNDMP